MANHVGLGAGYNTLTAVVTHSNGSTSTDSIGVYRSTTENALRLTAPVYVGVAPFVTTVRIDRPAAATILPLSISGPGSVEVTAGNSETESHLRLLDPGVYYVTAKALDADNYYEHTVVLMILDRTVLDTLLQSKWSRMKQALANQDVPNALQYFTEETQALYQEIFVALADRLPQMAQTMPEIQLVEAQDSVAKYRIRTPEVHGGRTDIIAHYIYFHVAKDGRWKILRF